MDTEQLAKEAWDLHHALSLACLAEEGKRDNAGHRTGDLQRIRHLDRLIPLAADRWRRRMGYSWRRVPAGVRGSR